LDGRLRKVAHSRAHHIVGGSAGGALDR